MSNESEILIKGTESFNTTRKRIRDYLNLEEIKK